MFLSGLLQVLMVLVAIFLILLVLVQRGRGGGLTGALGGMGGQSAFGTKAGDLFTKITIVAALVWIVLACISVKIISNQTQFEEGMGAQRVVHPGGELTTSGESADGTTSTPPAESSGQAEKPTDEPGK